MGYENLRVERRAGIAFVTVDRPARLNALDARTLEAVHGGLDRPLGVAQEGEAQLFGELAATDDAHEGTRAFLEKRAPQFRGR